MHGHTEITPVEAAAAASRATIKQRVLVACYLTAAAVAMLGWLSAFSWAAAEVAKLLLT
jgi:hypothetical protein